MSKTPRIENSDGSVWRISRKEARQLLDSGEYELVRRRPLTLRPFTAPNFAEELRHLRGYDPNARRPEHTTAGGEFNGRRRARSVRIRRPRRASVLTFDCYSCGESLGHVRAESNVNRTCPRCGTENTRFQHNPPPVKRGVGRIEEEKK